MNEEVKLLRNILSNERLMKLVSAITSILIKKLIDQFDFDLPSFLSDNDAKFGNIGNANDQTELHNKIKHLLSESSTIREKTTAILNAIINGADNKGKFKDNGMVLYGHILSMPDPNQWIITRRNYCKFLVDNNLVDQTDNDHLSRLWAPIYYLYPTYKAKHDLTHGLIRHTWTDKDKNEAHTNIKDLTEPLSEYEKKFLSLREDTYVLSWITGKHVYKDIIHHFPEYKVRDKTLIIAGISGHSILLLELAKIVDVNWIPIMFACIISQVPHHHSMMEIFDTINEMKLYDMSSYNSSNYLNFFVDMAKKINVSLSIY